MPRVKFTRDVVLGKEDRFKGDEADLSEIDAHYAVEIYKAAEFVSGAPTGLPGEITVVGPDAENGDPTKKDAKRR